MNAATHPYGRRRREETHFNLSQKSDSTAESAEYAEDSKQFRFPIRVFRVIRGLIGSSQRLLTSSPTVWPSALRTPRSELHR